MKYSIIITMYTMQYEYVGKCPYTFDVTMLRRSPFILIYSDDTYPAHKIVIFILHYDHL